MSRHPGQQPPLLGATFIPGGFDDYYMPAPSPEVISPAPQRVMPEVPEHMQENIAALELDASTPTPNHNHNHNHNPLSPPPNDAPNAAYSPIDQQSTRAPSYSQEQPPAQKPDAAARYPPRHSSMTTYANPAAPEASPSQSHDYSRFSTTIDVPNFSPFPRLETRPPNVPPTDDEKEAVLENARLPVLNSNDPEMQLAWAQDVLIFVDVAVMHDQRISETETARSATPQIEHQLRVDAVNIVNFLAEQFHPRAEFIKGMWLEFGKFGLRQDKKEAFRCYGRAAEKGYSRAEYRMGMLFEQANDAAKALIHYQRGSESGDSAANYRLGMMTLLGQHGQQQDFPRGIQLIRQAAQSADENAPQGAYVLGMLQARELPQISIPEIYLPYDERSARQNIEKAAFLGFAKAQMKMGQAYELCTMGCEFNPALSLHYNALAARQGEAEAEMAISKWFLCGYEGVFQKNEELAYTYARRAAQSGSATAEFAIGYFNEIGMYVPVSVEKALEWYGLAAKSGNKDAQSRIENISKSRTLSKKDHEDVAIQRIRSQYGSRRGGRPERFQNPPAVPVLQTISDARDSTPVSSPVGNRFPDRSKTTTPYPLSDAPPTVGHVGLPPRSATVAPYPLADQLPQPSVRPGPQGGFFAPELRSHSAVAATGRPNSAFNINPNVYGSESGAIPRPYTTVGDMGHGRGQGLGVGVGVGVGGQRIASSGTPSPNSYRQPGGAPSVERPENYGQVHSQAPQLPQIPQQGRLDIGFSAPPEDRRQKLQKQSQPNTTKPQPSLPQTGYPSQHSSSSAYHPQADRPSTVQPGQQSRPLAQRLQDRPSSTQSAEHRPSSHQPQAPSKPTPNQPPKPAASSTPKPPGKGPKTFDEMGIQNSKHDSDCIVM